MFSLKKRLNRILAHHTGKSVEQIERDADRDNYMSAAQAAEYGLVDKVLEGKKDISAEAK
jgi:ATP-dependent Clp protease protease subunit